MLIFPVAYTLYMSFHAWQGNPMRPAVWMGIDNYIRMLTSDDRYWNAVSNTFYFTFAAVTAQIGSGHPHCPAPQQGLSRSQAGPGSYHAAP